MRFTFARWCWALLLLAVPMLGWAAPPAAPAHAAWQLEEISLPAQPLTAPLPWVKSPAGPGEFLLGQSFPLISMESTYAHQRRFIATVSGLLMIEPDGRASLVSAAFGQPCMWVGEKKGRLWVQQRDGTLLGLDPQTLAVAEQVHGLTGPCFAIDAGSIWCYDSMEMATGGLYKNVVNRFPFASALIEYDRTGREKRRFTADGVSLPKCAIIKALLDPNVLWVVINGDRARNYGEAQIFRVDRASGKVTKLDAVTNVGDRMLNLPAQLVWTTARQGQDEPGATCPINVLDKKTLAVTQPAQIPAKYANGLYAVQDGKLWCVVTPRIYDMPRRSPEEPYPTIAVFSLTDGRRIHVEDAGLSPAEGPSTTKRPPVIAYSVVGCQPDRAWVCGTDNRLYDIPDAGEPRQRDCFALGPIRQLCPRVSGMSDAFLGYAGDLSFPKSTLLQIFPHSDRAIRCVIDEVFPVTASIQRAWFISNGNILTCGEDLKPRTIKLSDDIDTTHLIGGTTVSNGDKLYFFIAGNVYVADAAAGTVVKLASWRRDAPKALWKSDDPEAAFRTSDGRIVFNLYTRAKAADEDSAASANHATLACYDPGMDSWTFTPNDRITFWGDTLETPYGTLHVPEEKDVLYRGTATDWKEVGRLPFCIKRLYFSACTARYLYLDTPLGLYRVRWAELLPAIAGEAK